MKIAIKSLLHFRIMGGFVLSAGALTLFTGCEKAEDSAGPAEKDGEVAVAVSDWPLFRGDPEMQGVSAEVVAPPLRLAWTFEPPAPEGKRRPPIEASPVIANSMVFVGSQDGHFYALDLAGGELLWTFKAEGPIIAPAAVLGDRIFFGDTYGFVYALTAESGEELWRFETEGKIEGGVNTLSPEGEMARVYVGSHDYFLYCLGADSGEVLWKHETGNYVVSTPSMIHLGEQQAIAFGGCDGLLHVVPADGKGEAREIEIGAYIANTSAMKDGIAYVAHNGGEVIAVNIESGETVWKTATGIEYTASPAVDEEVVYVAGPDKRLVAYDRIDGSEKWAFVATRSLSSSPLVSDGIVWQASMDGRLYAIKRDDGSEVWSFDVGSKIKSSPAVSRGTLVICGDDGLVYGFTM